MNEISQQPNATPFWNTSLFTRVETALWIGFVMLPMFTGWLVYHSLPNETFDDDEHELLDFFQREDAHGNTHEVPAVWKHKQTGEIYSTAGFSVHRSNEAQRAATSIFAYGLLGCLFFAWMRSLRKKDSFYEAFGKATLVNLAVAIYLFLNIRGISLQ